MTVEKTPRADGTNTYNLALETFISPSSFKVSRNNESNNVIDIDNEQVFLRMNGIGNSFTAMSLEEAEELALSLLSVVKEIRDNVSK